MNQQTIRELVEHLEHFAREFDENPNETLTFARELTEDLLMELRDNIGC